MPARTVAAFLAAIGTLIPANIARAQDAPPTSPTLPPRERLRYVLQAVEVRGNDKTRVRVVESLIPFRPGDTLDVEDPEIEITRYRLLASGFFAAVTLSLRRGSHHGTAILVVELVERNTVVVQNLWLGIAAEEDTAGHARPRSAFVGVRVAETNLLGTGATLGGGVAIAEDQLALRAHIVDSSFAHTSWSVLGSLLFTDGRDFFGNRSVRVAPTLGAQPMPVEYAALTYQRFGGTIGTGHSLGAFGQFALEYHLEQISARMPAVATHLRGNTREPIDFAIVAGKSALSTLRASATYDSRDNPFLSRRGLVAQAAVTAGLPFLGSAYGYARIELLAQRFFALPWGHVVSTSVFAGGVAGSAPFCERFYVGDFSDLLPDRVLDLTPDRRQPPNILGTDIGEIRYGDAAAKIDVEYRVPIYAGKRAIYGIDVFIAGGVYGVAGGRDLSAPPSGYSGLRRVPVDLTYNLGVRFDTSLGGATIAFSNLLGLIPSGNTVRP